MGCDIHIHIEEADSRGEWKNITPHVWDAGKFAPCSIGTGRDYRLFGELAGVRGSQQPEDGLGEPRGFPDDACDVTNLYYDQWKGDAHTPSYFTFKELKEYIETRPESKVIQWLSGLREAASVSQTWGIPDDKNIRVVFWFDN